MGSLFTNETSINELENRIGAGLIEEVIQVAEGEHRLVNTMVEAKV
jgi:NADH dehydrogenase (ubiquinone) 1 alpha subcomplex subunit 5